MNSRPLARGSLGWAATLLAFAFCTRAMAAPAGGGGASADSRAADTGPIEIEDVRPLDPSPGTAVRLEYTSTHDVLPRFRIAGRDAPILHSADGVVVLRVPLETRMGFVKLRAGEGEHAQNIVLRVEPVQRRKLLRNILGGLALFLLGLRSLAQGLRRSVGPRDRGLLAGATGSPARALGFGVLMGGLTQSTTSAAAIFVGMRQAHMLTARTSIWVIVGAYLGTVVTAALLPLAATREALLVVAIGTPLLMFSRRRRLKGLGAAIVGFGLLALGLRFIQTGFQPLVGDPELVVYVKMLTGHGLLGGFVSAGIGALLAAALQGPGPVFALVMGVAQSSGVIDLESAMAVLAGAALGSSVGVSVLAIPYGEAAARLRRGFFWFGVCALFIQVIGMPLWIGIADALVPGDPSELAHGKKVLLPAIATHLAVGFGAAQLAVLVAFALLMRLWQAVLDRRGLEGEGAAPSAAATTQRAGELGSELASMLDTCTRAITSSLQTARTHGDRPRSAADDAVEENRERLDWLTTRLTGTAVETGSDPVDYDRRVTSLAIAHLHTSVASVRDTAERAIADNLKLLPEIDGAATEIGELLMEGLRGASAALRGAPAESLEVVQAREIRINAIESSLRKQLLARPRADTAEVFLGSQLLSALENAGNHLFRVGSALATAPDEFL